MWMSRSNTSKTARSACVQRLPAVAGDLHPMALQGEQLDQVLGVELIVLGQEDVQRRGGGGGARQVSRVETASPPVRSDHAIDRLEQLLLLNGLEQMGVDAQLPEAAPGRRVDRRRSRG